MAISQQQITNQALIYLEEDTQVESSSTVAGRTIDEIFDFQRRLLLKKNTYGWTFARKLKVLGQISNPTTMTNYQYAYNLPSDYLMMWKVDGSTATFARVGNYLYSNESSLKIGYVSDVDVSVATEEFSIALSYRLASECAGKVTGKTDIKQDLYVKYMEALAHAIQLDIAQQDTQQYLSPVNIPYMSQWNSGFYGGSYSGL